MASLLIKSISVLIFWGIFIFVILQVPYPETLTQANIIQLFSFFITLFLALSLTINLFIKNILVSLSFSLGIISMFILKALDSLNLVTASLTAVSVWLLISYFRKRRSLTNYSKIRKLHAGRKQNE